MEQPYQPISCSYHDILLEKATFRKRCTIVYHDAAQQPLQVEAIIKDVYTQAGAEYMLLDNQQIIRLDYIVSVDGQVRPDSSCAI